MNLLLFTPEETLSPLPLADARAVHLQTVLHCGEGQSFDAGLVNGPRGRGTVHAVGPEGLRLTFVWADPPPAPDAITLVIGLPRPQTARDILRDATTLGLAEIQFVVSEKSDVNYARSSLWQEGEWRRHLLTGAAQAFDTRIPQVGQGDPLATALASLPAGSVRLALDNYEATAALSSIPLSREQPVVLALGPERGWGAGDRALLREHGFTLVHLGTRVLRLEMAVISALTLVKSARGSL